MDTKALLLVLDKYKYEVDRFYDVLRRAKKQSGFISRLLPRRREYSSVILLYGDPGAGQSGIAQHMYEEAKGHGFHTIHIDWYDIRQRHPEWFEQDRLASEGMVNAIYVAFRDAGYGRYFSDYEKACDLVAKAEQKVYKAIKTFSGDRQMPESLPSTRDLTARAIRKILGKAVLGPSYDLVSDEVLSLADKAISESIQMVVEAAKSVLNRRETDAYFNSIEYLIHSLVTSIDVASRKKGAFLVFLDHYEVVMTADPWLRRIFRQTSLPVVWLVVSHSSSTKLVEEYRNDIDISQRLLDTKFEPLGLDDVEKIINSHPKKKRNATPGEIRKVFEATKGNLLALQVAMEMWVPGGHRGVEVLEASGYARSRIAETLVSKYLTSKLISREDRRILEVLAFSPNCDEDFIKDLIEVEDPHLTLEHLSSKYPHLFEKEHRLLPWVSTWLKENLLTKRNSSEFQEVAERALRLWQAKLKYIEEKDGDIARCVNREDWRLCAVNTAYHSFWVESSSGEDALAEVLQALLFLPKPAMIGMTVLIWEAVGPLPQVRPAARKLLEAFQQGIAGLIVYPSTARVRVERGKIVDENDKVIADVSRPSLARLKLRALDRLESKPAVGARHVAIQITKAEALSWLGDFRGAAAILDSVIKSDNSVPHEVSIAIGKAYQSLADAIINFSRRPGLAVNCLKHSIDLLGEDVTLLDRLVLAYIRMYNYEEAVRVADKVIAMAPDTEGVYNRKGIALLGLRRTEDAIQAFSDGVQHAEGAFQRAIILTNLGIAYERLGNPDKAEECYNEALNLIPNLPFTMLCKGLLALSRSADEALAEMRRAVEFMHFVDEAYVQNIVRLLAYADNSEAIEHLKKILDRSQPTKPFVRARLSYEIGRRYMQERNWNKASEYLKRSISDMPDFLPAHFALAQSYQQTRNYKAARDTMFRAIQLMDFNSFGKYFSELVSWIGTRMTDHQVHRYMRKVTKGQKRTVEEYLRKGAAEIVAGRYDRAVTALRAAARMDRDLFWPHYMLCAAELSRGNFSRAERHIENTIIKLSEGMRGFAYYAQAHILEAQEKLDEAIKAYNKSLDEYNLDKPINQVQRARVLFDLALCLYRRGEHEKALNTFREAHTFDPESPAGRLSNIVLMVHQGDLSEATLELRRLEEQLDWEESYGLTYGKWMSKRMVKWHKHFIAEYKLAPILIAAFLVGDEDTVSRIGQICTEFDIDFAELANLEHPLVQELAPVEWKTIIPKIVAATSAQHPEEVVPLGTRSIPSGNDCG